MDIYGIKNITNEALEFNYDKYYKHIAVNLKNAKTEDDKNEIKKISRQELDNLLNNISIDIYILKDNFINLLLEDNSSKYLWILYSKHENNENYIDKISNILKQENKITRAGTNTYKINGWMTHTLYVYQLVNNNIAKNIEIVNFNGNKDTVKQVSELHNIYNTLTIEAKFILKIFSLIHDIGVIEDIKFHDVLGSKYVADVLREIGLTQLSLDRNNISMDIKDFIKILEELIKCHTLITSLSSEGNDAYVENTYKTLLNSIPEIDCVKKYIPKILLLLAYGDIIAVDESLMDLEKYKRIKDCYYFFEQITLGKSPNRNKEMVTVERIGDIIGEKHIDNLLNTFDAILENEQIDKNQFVKDMYNIKLMRFTAPLMKTLKDTQLTIKILYELFELIGFLENKEELKNYTIIFVPDVHESHFVEQFKNGNFFNCINKMKEFKIDDCTYENINILKGTNSNGKFIHIRVI